MAVSSEHLQCSICRELFRKPRTLIPCLHTFCEVCLHGCIMDQVASGQVNAGFKCPFCTAFVAEPASGKSPNEWATIYPLNHLIVSLLDTFKNQNRFETKSGEYSRTEISSSNNDEYHLNSDSKQSQVSHSDTMNGVVKPVISSTKDGQNVNTTRINGKQENRPETGMFVTRSTVPIYANFKIKVGRGDNNDSICFDEPDYAKLAHSLGLVPEFSDEVDYVLLRNDANQTSFFNKESHVPDKTIASDSDILLPPPPPPCGSRPRTTQQHVSPVKASSNHQHPPNCSSTIHHTLWQHPVKSYLQYGSEQPQIGQTSYHPTGYSILYGDF